MPLIQADSAQMVANPQADTVSVAVIDDGIAPHLDLDSSRIDTGWDVMASKSGGFDGDPSPGASRSHGMKVTGILAAAANDTGVVGVNPRCRIRPFKIFSDGGTPSDNYRKSLAIDSAVAAGAVIISCSWKANATPTAELEESIIRASDSVTISRPYTCVFFFGTGNDHVDSIPFPASMNQTIAVGAVGADGARCSYSNYGWGVDIMGVSDCTEDVCEANMICMDQIDYDGENTSGGCPPYDIPDLDYTRRMNGTSAACPQASALAAMLLSRAPYLIKGQRYALGDSVIIDSSTFDMVRLVLQKSADDLAYPGFDVWTGYGRINAWHAMLSVIHGDLNNDAVIDALDLNVIIDILFFGGHATLDDRTADVNCDLVPDALDMNYLIDILHFGGPQPPICFEF